MCARATGLPHHPSPRARVLGRPALGRPTTTISLISQTISQSFELSENISQLYSPRRPAWASLPHRPSPSPFAPRTSPERGALAAHGPAGSGTADPACRAGPGRAGPARRDRRHIGCRDGDRRGGCGRGRAWAGRKRCASSPMPSLPQSHPPHVNTLPPPAPAALLSRPLRHVPLYQLCAARLERPRVREPRGPSASTRCGTAGEVREPRGPRGARPHTPAAEARGRTHPQQRRAAAYTRSRGARPLGRRPPLREGGVRLA